MTFYMHTNKKYDILHKLGKWLTKLSTAHLLELVAYDIDECLTPACRNRHLETGYKVYHHKVDICIEPP